MTEQAAPGVGETFGGYTIESLLGRGGMGAVYLATHNRLGRKVALKVISPELAHDEDFRARFLRESQLAGSLDHPNVIPIYDADEVDGVLYLAMRYVNGPSLQRLLRDNSLPLEGTLRLADQIGGALDAAHRTGLVHRDVKPANILLAEPDGHAYLCDFGLAKRTSSRELTQTGFFLGTVDYCAPEQIRGLPLDGRADVYSLGCVLFQCLSGQRPYIRQSDLAVLDAHLNDPPPELAALRPDLPPAVGAAIVKATAKDPEARYATAGDLAAALTTAVGAGKGEVTRAAPTVPVRVRGRRRLGRRGRTIAAVALVLALAAAAAGVLATRGSEGGSGNAAGLRTFVDRLENILQQAADGRHELESALVAGFDCTISPQEAAQRIASVADNRQSILGQLGTLPAPDQQANDTVTFLQQALQQSIETDRHDRDGFLAIPPAQSCPLPQTSGFTLANRSNARATAAKKRFAAAFDPLARRFGRRTWSAGEF